MEKMKTVDFSEAIAACDLKVGKCRQLIMPPTLKKLMGHIAFGACMRGWVGACVTLFVPTVTFKPLKLES